MLQPEDMVTINSPVVEIYQSESERALQFSSGIIFSIQLASGLIITSPEKFTDESNDRTIQILPAPFKWVGEGIFYEEDISSEELARLAKEAKSFDFLENPEEDIYSLEDGEPL